MGEEVILSFLNLDDYLYDIQLFHNFYTDEHGEPMDAEDAIEE